MNATPWAFHLHVGGWAAVAAVGFVHVACVRRLAVPSGSGRGGGRRSYPPRQLRRLVLALAVLAVALTWPVADLAAHWSLTALVVQRLLLTLVVAPLLLVAVPELVLSRLTRPVALDTAVDFVTRPAVAVVVFVVLVVGTLITPAVEAQASSVGLRALFDALLLLAGFVLWLPVLRVPGGRRLSAVGRAAYLVVQSVLPNFPAIVFVFARHPLYAAFAHAHRAIGLSALNDQQLAGVVAKVGTLPVLWTVAWMTLARGQHADESGEDEEPLTWAEVERALERSERLERGRRAGRSSTYRSRPPTLR